MKYLFLIISVTFLLACNVKQQQIDQSIVKEERWSEEQKREYFGDSIAIFRIGPIDSSSQFSSFFKRHYPNVKTKYADPFIYAFEESFIDTTRIDTTTKWFRLTVEPCFRLPYCLIIEKKKGKTFLTTKVTNGDGGYNTGTLVIDMKLPVGDTVFDNIVRQLNSLNFWTLGYDTTCHGGFDGETWIFESIDKGRYNFVSRWVPQVCGDETTIRLAQLGVRIRELSRLEEVLGVFGYKGGM